METKVKKKRKSQKIKFIIIELNQASEDALDRLNLAFYKMMLKYGK